VGECRFVLYITHYLFTLQVVASSPVNKFLTLKGKNLESTITVKTIKQLNETLCTFLYVSQRYMAIVRVHVHLTRYTLFDVYDHKMTYSAGSNNYISGTPHTLLPANLLICLIC